MEYWNVFANCIGRLFSGCPKKSKFMIHFIKALGGVDKRAPKRSLEAQKRDLENLDVFLYHVRDEDAA